MRISPYYTPDEFCSDPVNVDALVEFLNSPPGQALQSVLMGLNPARQSLRAPTMPDSIPERAEHLLGKCQGFEFAFELITQTLTQKARPSQRQSSKASGPRSEIKPVSPPMP